MLSQTRGTGQGRPSRWKRGRGTVLALALLAPLTLVPVATEAAWTAPQTASTTLAADTLKTPVITGCNYYGGVLGIGATVTVNWTFQGATYTPTASVRPDGAGAVTTEFPANTISVAGTAYTLEVKKGLLTGLLEFLGGVLFGTTPYTISVSGRLPGTNWVSPTSSVRFSGGNCTY